MKKIFTTVFIASVLAFSAHAEKTNLIEVDLSDSPVKLKNIQLIKIANDLMDTGIYSEDEGYKYKKTGEAYSLEIVKIFKDPTSEEAVQLLISGAARSEGFGWHSGYATGDSSCSITIYKQNGIWSSDHGDADCNTELDFEG